jgi:hypothetical protein
MYYFWQICFERPLQPEVAYAVFAVFGSFIPQKLSLLMQYLLFCSKKKPSRGMALKNPGNVC